MTHQTMHMSDTTALEHYLQKLPSNDLMIFDLT